jgi:integrase/recombinase XerD
MRDSLDRIARLLGVAAKDVPWHRMRFAETEAIRGALLRANYSRATMDITLASLRGVLKQARRLGLMTAEDFTNATEWDRVGGEQLPAGRDLSNDEIARLATYCRSVGPDGADWPTSAYGAFLGALFGVLIGAGLRATEASRLPVEAYDRAERSLRLVRKGKKERVLPLGLDTTEPLDVWLAVRAELDVPTPALFVRVQLDGSVRPQTAELNRRAIEYLCDIVAPAAGIARFTPHDCRRTFATRTLDGGIDLSTVQRLMSHSSPKTTARYDKRGLKADAKARDGVRLWPGATEDEAK